MGTETIILCKLLLSTFEIVKLNNPLMGTETQNPVAYTYLALPVVKLNNPLMGTETRCHHDEKYKT